MCSLITMQAPVLLVNCGLNENPSALKNVIDLSRSLTGRLTKIWLTILNSDLVRPEDEPACRDPTGSDEFTPGGPEGPSGGRSSDRPPQRWWLRRLRPRSAPGADRKSRAPPG